jgi:hypothetical protein
MGGIPGERPNRRFSFCLFFVFSYFRVFVIRPEPETTRSYGLAHEIDPVPAYGPPDHGGGGPSGRTASHGRVAARSHFSCIREW